MDGLCCLVDSRGSSTTSASCFNLRTLNTNHVGWCPVDYIPRQHFCFVPVMAVAPPVVVPGPVPSLPRTVAFSSSSAQSKPVPAPPVGRQRRSRSPRPTPTPSPSTTLEARLEQLVDQVAEVTRQNAALLEEIQQLRQENSILRSQLEAATLTRALPVQPPRIFLGWSILLLTPFCES